MKRNMQKVVIDQDTELKESEEVEVIDEESPRFGMHGTITRIGDKLYAPTRTGIKTYAIDKNIVVEFGSGRKSQKAFFSEDQLKVKMGSD